MADVPANVGGTRQRLSVPAWQQVTRDVMPRRLGHTLLFTPRGLGRHTIGSNFFHYNPDPWGSWIEWFSDIDQIDDCWVAGDWNVPPPLWGAPPPKTFLSNLEPRD